MVKIDFSRARKWPTIVASDMANAPTAWDTHNNTLYHTPDANMTSLSIRHDRTDERGRRASALAQRTAAARASRDQDMHSPCPCAIEASCRPSFVATLASHCPRRTSAQAHTRAHVSINMTCSYSWLQAGMRLWVRANSWRKRPCRRRKSLSLFGLRVPSRAKPFLV